jgi:hypothetical protein
LGKKQELYQQRAPAFVTMAEGSITQRSSIVLRAPDGEVGWSLVELQGTLEPRHGGSLDGIEFATLQREVMPTTCMKVPEQAPRPDGTPLRIRPP